MARSVVRAQSTTTYSSYATALSTDWNDNSNLIMSSDLCGGIYNTTGAFFGYAGAIYSTSSLGASCSSLSGNAAIDMYTASGSGVPLGVYYNYIDIYTTSNDSGDVNIIGGSDYGTTIASGALTNTQIDYDGGYTNPGGHTFFKSRITILSLIHI